MAIQAYENMVTQVSCPLPGAGIEDRAGGVPGERNSCGTPGAAAGSHQEVSGVAEMQSYQKEAPGRRPLDLS